MALVVPQGQLVLVEAVVHQVQQVKMELLGLVELQVQQVLVVPQAQVD